MAQESVDQEQSAHLETQGPAAPAAPSPHSEPASRVSAPPILQVPAAQLDEWRADVAEQRQVVALAQATLTRACEALDQCSPGGAGWGELRREQRYLQHQLEAEQRKLAQFELFVSLIEQGSSRDDACEQVYSRFEDEASPEAAQAAERQGEAAEAAAELPASRAEPTPEPLQPKAWRAALFTGVLALFGWEVRHLNQNSRGLANKAAMLRHGVGDSPRAAPAPQAAFRTGVPDGEALHAHRPGQSLHRICGGALAGAG